MNAHPLTSPPFIAKKAHRPDPAVLCFTGRDSCLFFVPFDGVDLSTFPFPIDHLPNIPFSGGLSFNVPGEVCDPFLQGGYYLLSI